MLISWSKDFTKYNFTLNALKTNIFIKISLTLLLLSLAGLPPLVGFLTKILILSLATSSLAFLNYIIFFIFIFIFLYFYIQNLKFIFSSNHNELNYIYFNTQIKNNNNLTLMLNISILIILFNIFILDDFINYFLFLIL